MTRSYNQPPQKTLKGRNREISVFNSNNENTDLKVVASFGEEWSKFHSFDEQELKKISEEYFDIIDDTIVNSNTYGIDIGCGSGRWTKCLLPRIGYMEAVDPSEALLAADQLLGDAPNVRLTMASTDNLPFADGTFDFAMSIGVLHHIPDTQKAMTDCVKKVKAGGYFYTYLYYSLDNKGIVSRLFLSGATGVRKIVSSMPAGLKKASCDVLAVAAYMPFVLLGRVFKGIGLKKLASRLPLSIYQDKSFYIIRNDSLDRFGTALEQRFSRKEIIAMMTRAGLGDIRVSENMPYWHAIGRKIDQ